MIGDKQELSAEEVAHRRDAALLRALSTPHKRQKEMKIGKRSIDPQPSSAQKKRPGK
jgi:hypothetical protein